MSEPSLSATSLTPTDGDFLGAVPTEVHEAILTAIRKHVEHCLNSSPASALNARCHGVAQTDPKLAKLLPPADDSSEGANDDNALPDTSPGDAPLDSW